MTTASINQKIHTSCKNCLFAEYDSDTQIGCNIGRLDKFRQKNPNNILECYDNDKEFFVINNKYCLGYRNTEWGNHYDPSEWSTVVRKQMELPYLIMVVVDQYKGNIDTLAITLKSIAEQQLKCKMVAVINKQPITVPGPEIIEILDTYKKEIPFWKIQAALHPELTTRDYIDLVIDGTKQYPYSIYVVVNSGFSIPLDFAKVLDSKINDDLLQFSMILPNSDDNGMIVPKAVHLAHNGNSHGICLETKIEHDIYNLHKPENEGEEWTVSQPLKIHEVIPSFPQ